jgi:hypothetical protein
MTRPLSFSLHLKFPPPPQPGRMNITLCVILQFCPSEHPLSCVTLSRLLTNSLPSSLFTFHLSLPRLEKKKIKGTHEFKSDSHVTVTPSSSPPTLSEQITISLFPKHIRVMFQQTIRLDEQKFQALGLPLSIRCQLPR